MLDKLVDVLYELPRLLQQPERWSSLKIDRRKPHTFRIFTMYDGLRVCLHRFNECLEEEAFFHPHPWPAAFIVLKGAYEMKIGRSVDRLSEPQSGCKFVMTPGSRYEITDELTWHSVVPLKTTYTVMVNGEPFANPHKDVRTTKGKDLEKMSDEEVVMSLFEFDTMIKGL